MWSDHPLQQGTSLTISNILECNYDGSLVLLITTSWHQWHRKNKPLNILILLEQPLSTFIHWMNQWNSLYVLRSLSLKIILSQVDGMSVWYMNHWHHCGEVNNNNLMPLEWLQLSAPMVRQTHVIMVIGHMVTHWHHIVNSFRLLSQCFNPPQPLKHDNPKIIVTTLWSRWIFFCRSVCFSN